MVSRSSYDQKLNAVEAELVDLNELCQLDIAKASERTENLRPKVDEVRMMKEMLKQAGQPWQAASPKQASRAVC